MIHDRIFIYVIKIYQETIYTHINRNYTFYFYNKLGPSGMTMELSENSETIRNTRKNHYNGKAIL